MAQVYFVGAGPGDPDLITVRGLELLKTADLLIYAGSLINPDLVNMSAAPVKQNSFGMSLEELTSVMVEGVKEGKRVVRLHSGDPSLYGAIVEQISELEKHRVAVTIVPGVSSMFGAAAALATQLTLKGVSDSVIVTRPAGKTLDNDRIRELSRFGFTMVIFLGTEQIDEVLARVEYPPETPVAVVYHATWPDQKVILGTVSDVAEKVRNAGIEKTALIIIGDVVEASRSHYERSDLYG